MHEAATVEEMERAFLKEFEEWWPFAKTRLARGERVTFSVRIEQTGPGKSFIQGGLDTSWRLQAEDVAVMRQSVKALSEG